MLHNIFYIIPSVVCIVWALIFMLRKKSVTQKIAMQMLCISAVYFFLYIIMFTPGMDYIYLCAADVVAIPLVLALLASLMIFVNSHMSDKILSNAKMQWFYAPALVVGGIVAVLYYIIGFDKAAAYYAAREAVDHQHPGFLSETLPDEFNSDIYQIFYFFDFTVLNILLALMSIIVISVCALAAIRDGYKFGDTFKFHFKGKATTPTRVITHWVSIILITVLPLSVIGRTYIIQNPWIGCTISVLVSIEIFILCHCEAISNLKSFTLYEMTHMSNEYYLEEKAESHPQTSFRAIEKTNSLVTEVHKAIEEDKIWLNTDLRLSTLAEKLNTNRNKLSVIINHIYGNDFKTLITNLRIEEAKRLIKENPTATMEYIALNCGFKESTIFFHRFKDVVGLTPTEWKTQTSL